MRLQRYTLRRKFTLILTTYSFVALALIFVVMYIFVQRQNVKTYQMNAYKKVNSAIELMNKELYTTVDKSNHIINNPMVLRGFMDYYEKDMRKILELYNMLEVYYSSFSYIEGNLESPVLIYTKRDIFPVSKYTRKIAEFPDNNIGQSLENNKNTHIIWDTVVRKEASGSEYISLYRNIYSFNEHLGYLEMRVPLKVILEYLKNIELLSGEKIEFMDRGENRIFENGRVSDREFITEGNLINDFTVRVSMPYTAIQRDYVIYAVGFFLFLCILFYLFFIISRNTVSSVTDELYGFLDDIKGNREWTYKSDDSEMNIIKQKFQELILSERKMHSDIIEMNKVKKSLELEILQSRINPHLLYNSFSVIKWQFLRHGDMRLTELIDAMTNYYRIALNNGNTIIKLKNELEMIREFVRINELSRFCEYEFMTDIDEKLQDCYTIKLLLQPIVENAIMHGLSGRKDAKIKLSIKEEGLDILISVEDNGYGMSQKTVDELLNMTYKSKHGSYGIKNTIKRIKTYYGEEYGIKIKSERDKGTCVMVKIAMLTEEELMERIYF